MPLSLNKASIVAMPVSSFNNFHKLSPVVYNYRNLFNFGVCKGVKSFGKQLRNYTVYSKTAIKTDCVDKKYRLPLIYLCKTLQSCFG